MFRIHVYCVDIRFPPQCRLQKNRTLVYDTQVPAPPSSRRRWRGTDGTKAGHDDDGSEELRNGSSSEG